MWQPLQCRTPFLSQPPVNLLPQAWISRNDPVGSVPAVAWRDVVFVGRLNAVGLPLAKSFEDDEGEDGVGGAGGVGDAMIQGEM